MISRDVKKIKVFPMSYLKKYKNSHGCSIYFKEQNDKMFGAISNQVRNAFELIKDDEKFDKSEVVYAYTLNRYVTDMKLSDVRICVIKDRELIEITDRNASNKNYGCFQIVMDNEDLPTDVNHRGFKFQHGNYLSFKEYNHEEEI
jgi:hypothetical protein